MNLERRQQLLSWEGCQAMLPAYCEKVGLPDDARHPRFHVHFTPTSGSWLNQVERWFAALTEKYIRRATHRSTRQLEQAIRQYLDIHNANPTPFVWTKSADDILASIERFCLRISNSGH